jgi:hypothetical protein
MFVRSIIIWFFLFFVVSLSQMYAGVPRSPFVNQLLRDIPVADEMEHDEAASKKKKSSGQKKIHNKNSFFSYGPFLHRLFRKGVKGVAYCGGLAVWRVILPRWIAKRPVFADVKGGECVSFCFGVLVLTALYNELFQERTILNLPAQLKKITESMSFFGQTDLLVSPSIVEPQSTLTLIDATSKKEKMIKREDAGEALHFLCIPRPLPTIIAK